jgi:hypothetical protein
MPILLCTMLGNVVIPCSGQVVMAASSLYLASAASLQNAGASPPTPADYSGFALK